MVLIGAGSIKPGGPRRRKAAPGSEELPLRARRALPKMTSQPRSAAMSICHIAIARWR